MDLSSFKELGIAVVAVGVIGYITLKLLSELSQNRKDYSSFVMDNNHTNTELVKEATATMVEVRNSIETHNRILEKLIDKIN